MLSLLLDAYVDVLHFFLMVSLPALLYRSFTLPRRCVQIYSLLLRLDLIKNAPVAFGKAAWAALKLIDFLASGSDDKWLIMEMARLNTEIRNNAHLFWKCFPLLILYHWHIIDL